VSTKDQESPNSMQQQYQLAIIGGGIQGAALFWEAVHRGIDTVLLERDDYGAGTSANSLRVVHGGLRHLQRADLRSCLQMIREQRILLRVAPALVRPLPCVMPTTRTGKRSAAVMRGGLWLYDRLRQLEAMTSASQVTLPASGVGPATTPVDDDLQTPIDAPLAGWYDAQALHAERLTLAFVNAGRRLGGSARNHTAVTACRRVGGALELNLERHLDGNRATLRCQQVIDCSGDWRFHAGQPAATPPRRYVKAVNLLLDRPAPTVARGLYASNEHVNNRLLFLTPWRGRLLVGTWYFPAHDRDGAGNPRLSAQELAVCRRDLDSQLAQPLRSGEILHAQVGYLPAHSGGSADPADDLVKNGSHFGSGGLAVVEATKFTTVRALARGTIDRLGSQFNAGASNSHQLPLTESFDQRLFSADSLQRYDQLLRGHCAGLPAEVLADADHAIEHEQVGSLADLVRRRLPLGDLGPVPAAVTDALLARLATRLGWSAARQQQERLALAAEYPLMEVKS
jgi:glycerol-3-phosphate dehydrogenase